MELRVNVRGDARLRQRLARAASRMDDPREALRAAAKAVAERARVLTPKDTRRLSKGNHARVTKHTATVYNRVRYAGYVEHGTQIMRAQPYLRPALTTTDIGRFYDELAADIAQDI